MNNKVAPVYRGSTCVRMLEAAPPAGALVPILPMANLFLTLIPFLLLCASFAPLAAAPMQAGTVLPPSADSPTLTLIIRPSLFRLEPHGGTVAAARLRTLAMSVPRTVEDAEGAQRSYGQLVQALVSIKQRLAGLDTVAVVPDDTITYEEVVTTLDVVRDLSLDGHGELRGARMFQNLVLGDPLPAKNAPVANIDLEKVP